MIDTLYTLRTIPISTTIRDSILTNSTLSGGLDINGIDSLNLILSGTPTVSVLMPAQLDGATIVAIVSIIANIVIVGLTFYSKKWLQKHETEEIRNREMQNIAIKQQANLYELLVEISYLLQSPECINDSQEISWEVDNKDLNAKILYAKLFLSKNELFITDELSKIAYELLDLFVNIQKFPSVEISKAIEFKLWQYSNIYKGVDISDITNLLNGIENIINDEQRENKNNKGL